MSTFVAVDLGASSGRVMLGRLGTGIELVELRRFRTGPRSRPDGGLRWDITEMLDEITLGLRAGGPANPVSIGLDSWAIDYGLIDADGRLDGDVRSYRDSRTDGVADRLRELIDDQTLYRVTGLQYLPFNTIYQLLAEPPQRLTDHIMLLLPDLLGYLLTGAVGAEVTNASTTGLLDATSRQWAPDVLTRAGIPASLLPTLRQPGDHIGLFDRSTPVLAVASHDTASAVAAVPAADRRFGYVSCGTWSLVGLELDAPVLTEAARLANFTNESGVDGTTRFLRNTMGLWLLDESLRTWRQAGMTIDLTTLLRAAAAEPAFAAVINPDNAAFLPPGDLPARIAASCRRSGQRPPDGPAAVARTILDSLAIAHAASLHTATRLAAHEVDVVHLVGGGARNELLCQLTADACGLPVLAGPVEASALGNVLTQARAAGLVRDTAAARSLVRAAHSITRYLPRGNRRSWQHAARRAGIEL